MLFLLWLTARLLTRLLVIPSGAGDGSGDSWSDAGQWARLDLHTPRLRREWAVPALRAAGQPLGEHVVVGGSGPLGLLPPPLLLPYPFRRRPWSGTSWRSSSWDCCCWWVWVSCSWSSWWWEGPSWRSSRAVAVAVLRAAIDGSSWRGSAAVTGDAVGAAATLTASPSSSTRSLPRPSGGPDLQSTARVRSGATRWGDPARPDAAPQGVR